MSRNTGKKIIAGLLMICMAGFVAPAQAGLLGALVGGVIEHHIEKQQTSHGDDTTMTDHPMAGAIAGSVAASAVEGVAIEHKVSKRDIVVGAVAGALIVGDAAGRVDMEKHGCSSVGLLYWSCPGIPGQHTLPVEARDLYILNNRSDAKELAGNMTAAGNPRPGSGCAAHHIVPSNEGRPFAQAFVNQAKNILSACGIGINSAINGAWLPQNKTAACIGAYHPTIHSQIYYKNVASRLYRAYMSSKNEEERCRAVKDELAHIKAGLLNGNMP